MAPDKQDKRREIANAVARHLADKGFADSGLRALAGSAGISDRMVLYYFASKEELITEALLVLGRELEDSLAEVLPRGRASANQIVDALLAVGQQPTVQPTLRLWFEVVGMAMRDNGPYNATARMILAGWEAWLRNRLGPDRAHLAPQLLARIEGELMISLLRS